MNKYFRIGDLAGTEWPPHEDVASYFLAPRGKEWSYRGGNDNWGFEVTGFEGTTHLERGAGCVDVDLSMWGHPEHGVLLYYAKFGGGHSQHLFSLGDMTRIKEWVRTLHGDLRPIGLYIPFAKAWLAVKEFMETDGQLPKSIEWVRSEDLPPNTFPDPWEHPEVK